MKNISFLSKSLIAGLLLFNSLNAQNNFVAKTGNDVITTEEFKARYELMPIVSVNKNEDSLKHELLYTLISEKLLAKEAESLGYDQRTQFTDIYVPLEKMFVRDALFKEEVEKKIKIDSLEIKKGMRKIRYELKLNVINSVDSAQIFSIYRMLLNGVSFDTLLQSRPEYKGQESPFSITYGSLEEEFVEDSVYSLVPHNFSSPIRTKDAWFIFYLRDKLPANEKDDEATLLSKVTKILKEKKSRVIGLAYMKTILGNLRVNADSTAFWIVVEKITGQLQKKDTLSNKESKDFIYLTEQDIAAIKNEFGPDTLKMIFVPFEKEPATINDFLNRYYQNEFKTKKTDKKQIAYKLSYDLHSFIESEILSREGYKKGFNKLPEVQHDLKMWKDNFLAQMYRNSFIPSVKTDDNDVLQYYNELYKSDQPVTMVKILEFKSPDLSLIETVLNGLKAGKDFSDIKAALTNVKEEEPDFFPITERGQIGKIAGKLSIGEVYGPMKVDDGYLLIKLIDKKEEKQTPPVAYDDIKEKLRMDLLHKKIDKILIDKTVELSAKYPTVINEKALLSLKLTSIEMFTYRYMGFGGRIAAVPYSYPFHDWINEAGKIKRILP